MKKSELEKMDIEALKKKIFSLRKELFELRLSVASTPIKDNSQFRKLRVDIARAMTYINQKR